MGKRTSGIAKKGFKNKSFDDNDVYFSEEVADVMIRTLKNHITYKKNPKILDACAGPDGVLGKTLAKHCKTEEVWLQDIKYNGKSILNYKPDMKYDLIICNPPFVPVELAEDIFHHLYSLLDDDGIMFFVINLTFFYQGWERAKKLIYQKIYFLPRYVFAWMNRPLLDVGVAVTHKNKIMPKQAIQNNCYIHIPKNMCNLQNEFFDIEGKDNPELMLF